MSLSEEEKKQKKRESANRYYQKNKEKINQKRKEKEKEYREKNKEKLNQKSKEWREKNKEKIKEYDKQYNQTPQRKKAKRINHWKQRGIVPPCSWDEFYEEYEKATNCEDCDVVMTVEDGNNTSTTKCADHDHSITDGSPNFRGFVCLCCNLRRG
jgi:hypothetical protein